MYTGEVDDMRDPKMSLNIYNPRRGWNITGSLGKEGLEELHKDVEAESRRDLYLSGPKQPSSLSSLILSPSGSKTEWRAVFGAGPDGIGMGSEVGFGCF